jgi:hypothetical protein
MIAIMLGFVARHPAVGAKAGAERRGSHSTAGIAALGKGAFRRGDQENRCRQHHSCFHHLISFRKKLEHSPEVVPVV